ncbi:MAG: hypothetical protein ACRCU3_01950 [Eubacteriaceae bacterium]
MQRLIENAQNNGWKLIEDELYGGGYRQFLIKEGRKVYIEGYYSQDRIKGMATVKDVENQMKAVERILTLTQNEKKELYKKYMNLSIYELVQLEGIEEALFLFIFKECF